MLLLDICCTTKSADILPLLTLAYDKSTIAGTFNILQKLIQVHELTKEIIYKKFIILKIDLLIIQNAIQAILKKENKSHSFYQYD